MEKTISLFRMSMSNRLNDMSRSAIVVVQRLINLMIGGVARCVECPGSGAPQKFTAPAHSDAAAE
jgi:hypothetical protein